MVELPPGSFAEGAAFSPSGGLLGLQVMSDEGSGPSAHSSRIGDQRPADGPAGNFGRRRYRRRLRLAAIGDSLVAEFIFPATVQLAAWHPGATVLAVAVVRPGQEQASLVVG